MPARRSPGPDHRVRDAERTRRRLLDAAFEEFASRGYAGARVGDIAERAGVNKQLISYYFGGKAGLYQALQRRWLAAESEFSGPDVSLPELMRRHLDRALADPRGVRLMLWRALTGDEIPDVAELPDDTASTRVRRDRGELAADLDPGILHLMLTALVIAPVAMPAAAVRASGGLDPASPEFAALYGEQLRRVLAHLAPAEPSRNGEDS